VVGVILASINPNSQYVKVVRDNLPMVVAALETLSSNVLYVGVPDANATRPPDPQDPNKAPINNAQLAYIHNAGSPARNIPARPFMTLGIQDARDLIQTRMKRLGMLALSGDLDIDKGFHALGLAVVSKVRARLVAGPWQPLAVRTVMERMRRRKGPNTGWKFLKHMTPLIDTSRMLQSITYVIRGK
jgi:hypothetical protein